MGVVFDFRKRRESRPCWIRLWNPARRPQCHLLKHTARHRGMTLPVLSLGGMQETETQSVSCVTTALSLDSETWVPPRIPLRKSGRCFGRSKKNVSPVSPGSFLCSRAAEPGAEQGEPRPQVQGPPWCSGAVFAEVARREGTARAKTLTPFGCSGSEPGYLLSKDESDCHLPFLLFVGYYQTALSCFQGCCAPRGRQDGGREGGNPSLCRNGVRVF